MTTSASGTDREYGTARSQESTSSRQYEEPAEQPVPLRSLLTKPVVISIANYGTLALLEIATSALIPLVWSTAIELCGLGLTPADIRSVDLRVWLHERRVPTRVLPARFGSGRVVVATVVAFGLLYALFLFENMLASVVWPLIVLQLVAISVSDMGFSSVFMFVSPTTANRRSLGALNGISQTVVSTQRAAGPAAAASLFAFSSQNIILGGQFADVVLLSLACVGLCVAVQLPRNTWKSQHVTP
ncbi:hypothetical protein EDB84DRAFT_1566766 [Lactarius hengduanensis]|nr:hypothetical protein EDB84DRAFT_1566766 [Lactarius hengduanensis]